MNDPQFPLFTAEIHTESDAVLARQLTRHIATRMGFGYDDRTRLGAMVAEIACQLLKHSGEGRVEFRITGEPPHQMYQIMIQVDRAGIASLDDLLGDSQPSHASRNHLLQAVRQEMDLFDINSTPGQGTSVEIGKNLPAGTAQANLLEIASELSQRMPPGILDEIREQDEELLAAFEGSKTFREELAGLQRELDDTNRGVVALYADLDEKARRLHKAQAAVAEAAQQWQTTFDAIGNGIALMEPGGEILRCNRAFTSLAGKSTGEI
ncbi:MAG: PAS domain-containing protein, partial [Omnitrophica WOR_2 bacterium]